jgi:hypothetical protein
MHGCAAKGMKCFAGTLGFETPRSDRMSAKAYHHSHRDTLPHVNTPAVASMQCNCGNMAAEQ